MKRPLYAACPRCGDRAEIIKFVWDWDEDESIALIRCTCGKSLMSYAESRVLKIDLNNPYMREAHFDLLVPPGWDPTLLNRISDSLNHW